MISLISGKMLKDALISAALTLSDMKKQVDELNVYPVPDGDTGTNMSLTLTNAMNALQNLDDGAAVSEVASVAASAMLRGARGNSGVITSLLFRGFSKGLADKKEADCDDMANALEIGVDAAYKAVMKPAEGTILTVARVSAEKARESSFITNDPLVQWSDVCAAARDALDKTPEQLPILKKAGVVDAGGKGLVIIFEEMFRAFKGEPRTVVNQPKIISDSKMSFTVQDDETQEITFGYCTEFIVNVTDFKKKPADLRKYLESIGDCVVVVDDEDIIKVHVHTDHPGQAIERGLTYGALCNMKIDNMRLQREKKAAARKKLNEKPVPAKPEKRFGFVAVANGSGVESMFTDLGADCIVKGGQTMNPSADDILRAVYSVPAEIVFILPNNKNIIMAAEQAQKLADRQVIVLPTRTVPMGITAMLNFDPSVNAETNTINMMAAADKVSTGLITYAARDSEYDGKRIRKGEIMALENGKIVSTSNDITKATYRLARGMCKKDSSFVTIISGCDVSDEDAEKVTEIVKAKCPNHVEVSHIRGGQPVYYYMISVE